MMPSQESPLLRDARNRYFRAHGLGIDGGYTARWARYPIGPVTLLMPNTKARRLALPFHDVHHIATGYGTSWIGEAEIAAWELAAGCGKHSAAWLLNFSAFFIGLFIAPRHTWRAFMRGRSSKSLYYEPWDDGWLDLTVLEMRQRLGLEHTVRKATAADRALFVACALPAATMYAAIALILWALVR